MTRLPPPWALFIMKNQRITITTMGSREVRMLLSMEGWGGSSARISTSRARRVSTSFSSRGAMVVNSAPFFSFPLITELSTMVTLFTSSCWTSLTKLL